MKFSEFRQYRPKSDYNVFAFICEDEFLIEESRSVWLAMFGGNWVLEKVQAKEFEDLEERSLMDEALTPSLFSRSRAILVANADKLSKQRIEALTRLQEVPRSSLKIVLISDNPKSAD